MPIKLADSLLSLAVQRLGQKELCAENLAVIFEILYNISIHQVHFMLQGEMSATVVYFPSSYTQLLTLLKDRVLQNTNFPRSNIQVGISTNFNKICGCVLQVRICPFSSPSSMLPLFHQIWILWSNMLLILKGVKFAW